MKYTYKDLMEHISEYSANNFMDELGKFLGAKFDHPIEKGGEKE